MNFRNRKKFISWTSINALLLAIVIAANLVAAQWSLALDLFLGQKLYIKVCILQYVAGRASTLVSYLYCSHVGLRKEEMI